MTDVERLKKENVYRLSSGTNKSGLCRVLAGSPGSMFDVCVSIFVDNCFDLSLSEHGIRSRGQASESDSDDDVMGSSSEERMKMIKVRIVIDNDSS